MSSPVASLAPAKAIPPARDRLQSRVLVSCVVPVLCALASRNCWIDVQRADSHAVMIDLAISAAFALLAWLLKAATPAAAACGGVICLLLTAVNPSPAPSLLNSGLLPLVLLFILTFLATRFGRARKEARGLSEPRTGRRASQVIANLGIAALCAGFALHRNLLFAAALAALAEATADTLSSEIGQSIGGPAYLLTSFRRVPPGTDGAISLAGTLAGLLGAAILAGSEITGDSSPFSLHHIASIFTAATAGLFFDSLLGATVERRGRIGNDLVNFASTAFAVAAFYALAYFDVSF